MGTNKKGAEIMVMRFSVVSNTRGVAIVAVTMVLVVVAMLGGAIISQTNHDTQLSNRVYEDKQAVYFAESAKERGYEEIMADESFTTAGNPGFLFDQRMPGGSYDLTAIELSAAPNKVVQLIATGFTDGGDTKEVDVVAEVLRENVVVWNNAIFGGSGAAGGVINGNAAIHGSVHLLGTNVVAGNNSIAAIDMSGSSLIHNNYTGMPAALAARVPGLPTTVYGGEDVGTIEAKLRVKNGSVGVSGESEIGEMNIVGNTLKETMDGIYIETDHSETRWTGNQVIDGVPDPEQVQSDNGTNALYDLGDIVVMPAIDEPFGGYASYDAYFNDNSLHLPPLTLDYSTDAANEILAYRAAGGFGPDVTAVADPVTGAFSVTSPNGTIEYKLDPATKAAGLRVIGMVQFDGDVAIGEKNQTILYAGNGTMYAAGVAGSVTIDSPEADAPAGSGNMDIHCNLLSAGTFPTASVMGLMAKNDIGLANGPGDSELFMAGAFFAGHKITSAKQNEILGSFVCNYFDMGTNIPKIYQVPALKDNLPPGLIGSQPIWVVTGFVERSWQLEVSPMAMGGGNYYPTYPEIPPEETQPVQ
jgi:hypothetical protein